MLELDERTAEAAHRLCQKAAAGAKYVSSPYHRNPKSKLGMGKVDRRFPAASTCHQYWTLQSATAALKSAINDIQVSKAWEQGFPKLVWYFDGETLYEARLTNSQLGEYKAYPLEQKREWPTKLQRLNRS